MCLSYGFHILITLEPYKVEKALNTFEKWKHEVRKCSVSEPEVWPKLVSKQDWDPRFPPICRLCCFLAFTHRLWQTQHRQETVAFPVQAGNVADSSLVWIVKPLPSQSRAVPQGASGCWTAQDPRPFPRDDVTVVERVLIHADSPPENVEWEEWPPALFPLTILKLWLAPSCYDRKDAPLERNYTSHQPTCFYLK